MDTTKPCCLAVFYNPSKRIAYQVPLEHVALMFDFLKTQCPGNLTGDFSNHDTSWETYQSSNDYEETIIIFAIDNNLEQQLNFKTTASSCLDLVFTSNDTLINSDGTETLDKLSDHHLVEIGLSPNEKTKKPGRIVNHSYCKCYFDEMVAEMKSNPFQLYCCSKIDVNTNL